MHEVKIYRPCKEKCNKCKPCKGFTKVLAEMNLNAVSKYSQQQRQFKDFDR